ncbi:LysR family transcriptional regulator [Martelella mediterranea]|uniref:D-malate degradation protein R n=1 Tax=Martelella mediterranea DSM 17316 TaxID=1122214 RepID=A0A1U9YYR0_9HYPH|nr:LysR family transcriptional regulator [Martelella mediterranea]AQZ50577.1 D-malate degradation protein R [Martelella mediterranea DSM 17316]
MDRLTSMAVYVKAVDLGSFAAAADALGISPQMVSKHIVFLEDRVGATLLHRTTRRQNITDIGRAFYERCRLILSEAEAAEGLASEMHRHPKGLLKVNAPKTFGTLALAPFVTRFLEKYPDVQVEVTLEDRFVDPLEEGFDVTIRVGGTEGAGLASVPLACYELVVCAAPAYLDRHGAPQTPQDLTRHECLIFGQRAGHTPCRWLFTEDGREREVQVSGRLYSNDWMVLMRAAVEGHGVALGSDIILREELRAGRLVRLLADYRTPPRPMHALYPMRGKPSAKIMRFVEGLAEAFPPRPDGYPSARQASGMT